MGRARPGREAATHFLLVHGAWHGGWVWNDLAAVLRSEGHAVTTPDLPSTPGTRLSDHVAALGEVLSGLLGRVTLVTHSYAGVLAGPVADRHPESIERVVFLDGWITRAGESLFDVAPDWFADWCRATATGGAEHAMIPPPPASALGVGDPALEEWLVPRLRPQPMATFTDAAPHYGVRPVPRNAIVCEPPTMPFDELAARAGLDVIRLHSDHEPMLSHTRELGRLLTTLPG